MHRALWCTLLLKANWKQGFFAGCTVEPGQLATSGQLLASELNISRTTLLRALSDLEKDGLLKSENVDNRFTLISIVSWHTYQENPKESGQPTGQPTDTIKEGKNIRTKNPPTPQVGNVDFEKFWQAYPKKTAKQTALKAWSAQAKAKAMPELESLLAALERQKQFDQWTKDNGKYVPHASTWLNGQRWLDDAGTDSTRPAWAQGLGQIL